MSVTLISLEHGPAIRAFHRCTRTWKNISRLTASRKGLHNEVEPRESGMRTRDFRACFDELVKL
jgi:hypothetical protein